MRAVNKVRFINEGNSKMIEDAELGLAQDNFNLLMPSSTSTVNHDIRYSLAHTLLLTYFSTNKNEIISTLCEKRKRKHRY